MKFSSLETVFNVLSQAKVRFLVAGGVAVNIYGYQRMTLDLDLVIQLKSLNINKAMVCLQELGFTPIVPIEISEFANAAIRKNWIETKNMQVLSFQSPQHPETTIDIFITEPFDFDKEYIAATIVEIAPALTTRIVSIQTLIAMKTQSNRPRDIDDIHHLELILNSSNEL